MMFLLFQLMNDECNGRNGDCIGVRGGNLRDMADASEGDSGERPTDEHGGAGVHTGSGELNDGRTRPRKRPRELPDWLHQDGTDLAEQYHKGYQERCDRLLGELQRSNGYLIRDIFRFDNDGEFETLLKCIQDDKHYKRGLLQVCREDTHVHIIHDCSWSNGSCRCNWWNKAKTYGLELRRDRRRLRRLSCRTRRRADVESLLLYYCTKERRICYQQIGGKVERIQREGYTIPEGRLAECEGGQGEVEQQVPGGSVQHGHGGRSLFDDQEDNQQCVERPKSKRRKVGAHERIQKIVVEMLEKYPCMPPSNLITQKVWLDNEDLRFKSMSDRYICQAVTVYQNTLLGMRMADYMKIYNKPDCQPIFAAGTRPFHEYYYDIDKSVEILDKLISFQCFDDEEDVIEFITALYNVVERVHPKLNCIVLHSSESSAGKNYLIDCIKAFYINVGHLCTANKTNNFAFQDLANRRLGHWNEPNYEESKIEKIKEILGGDNTNVNVKNVADAYINRTPVIVTTNNVVSFMTNPLFEDRLLVFNWQRAEWLKQYDKYPNPLCIYYLFKKYNLVV
nr:NS1 [Mute swan feces associated ambidensovirus 4]